MIVFQFCRKGVDPLPGGTALCADLPKHGKLAVVYKEFFPHFTKGGFERRLPVFDAAARGRNTAGLVAEGERAALKEDEEFPVSLNRGEEDGGLSPFFLWCGYALERAASIIRSETHGNPFGVLDKVGTAA